jgi:uncharacterized protein YecE (DUF72 family)
VHAARIGCSGWSYDDWREAFYPPRTPTSRRLAHYASVFDTVELNATLAIGDDRRRRPEAAPVAPLAYLRLHYGSRGREGNYSSRELDTWRRRIAAWRARRDVFVYLNDDWQAFAPRNALALREGLS